LEAVHDVFFGAFDIAALVGIFYPQDEVAAMAAGK
jgi:hypothetical protein